MNMVYQYTSQPSNAITIELLRREQKSRQVVFLQENLFLTLLLVFSLIGFFYVMNQQTRTDAKSNIQIVKTESMEVK
jgi:hypothetical protein